MKKLLGVLFIAGRLLAISFQQEVLYNPAENSHIIFLHDLHLNILPISNIQATAIVNLAKRIHGDIVITETSHTTYTSGKKFPSSIDFSRSAIPITNKSIKNVLADYFTQEHAEQELQVDPNMQLLLKLQNLENTAVLRGDELNESRLRFFELIQFFLVQIVKVPLALVAGHELNKFYREHVVFYDENMTLQEFFNEIDRSFVEATKNLKFLEKFERETTHRDKPLVQDDLEKVEKLRTAFKLAVQQFEKKFGLTYTIRELRERAITVLEKIVKGFKNYQSSDELFDDFYKELFEGPNLEALLEKIRDLLGFARIADFTKKQANKFTLSLFDLASLKEIVKQAPQHTIIMIAGFYHCMAISRYLQQNGWSLVKKSVIQSDYSALPTKEFANGDDFMQAISDFTDAKTAEFQQKYPDTWQLEINKLTRTILRSVRPLSEKDILSITSL